MPTSERTRDPMHEWPWPQNLLWLDPHRSAVSVSRWPMLSGSPGPLINEATAEGLQNRHGSHLQTSEVSSPEKIPQNPAVAFLRKQLFPAWWWACLTCILTWFVWIHKSIFKQQILYGYPNCWVSYNLQALAPSETRQMSPTTTLVNFKQLIPFQGLWIKACYTSSEPLLFPLSLHM